MNLDTLIEELTKIRDNYNVGYLDVRVITDNLNENSTYFEIDHIETNQLAKPIIVLNDNIYYDN